MLAILSLSDEEARMTNVSGLKVIKRDGREEAINLDKIHRVIEWAAEGLDNVSVSQVELKSVSYTHLTLPTSDLV